MKPSAADLVAAAQAKAASLGLTVEEWMDREAERTRREQLRELREIHVRLAERRECWERH